MENSHFTNQGDPTMNRGGLRNFMFGGDRRGNNKDRDDWVWRKMRNKQGMIYEYVFFYYHEIQFYSKDKSPNKS
mgnify:CR=1 FL=1